LSWLRWWNTYRIHSYLDYLSPKQFEVADADESAEHRKP